MKVERQDGPSRQGRVLVCFAVPDEAVPFKKQIVDGLLPPIDLLLTGMGRENAIKSISQALDISRPSLVITSGFAGALDRARKCGDIVGSWDPEFPSAIVEKAGVRVVRFHCSNTVISDCERKRSLFNSGAGEAVEMESQFIREACAARRIPSATIRVILDAAEESLPIDFESVLDANKRINWGKFSICLLKNPGAIPKLAALGRNSKACAAKLSEALCAGLQAGLTPAPTQINPAKT